MRALTRALVSVTTAAGIAVGGLAAASTATAAPEPAQQRTASAGAVSVLAVNNLGLSTGPAREWQRHLLKYGYNPGKLDGLLGTQSWKAAQDYLNHMGFRAGTVDGIVGPDTIRALQRFLNHEGFHLVVDGVAGAQTKAAFRHYNCGC
ncbi:peptidoglycan-binding domain-containing protein [Streptomyces sp. BBFR51]|uniref:peptidoglycan-binding domain-containing protein n=1 Tax=Streptomyces sp. BBFR51 TaxID=3372856 RepID=UPI0037DC7214